MTYPDSILLREVLAVRVQHAAHCVGSALQGRLCLSLRLAVQAQRRLGLSAVSQWEGGNEMFVCWCEIFYLSCCYNAGNI